MAQMTIEVNGRPYVVGCEDGQESRLTQLASVFDQQVRQVGSSVGQLGETRLFLMGALLLADELAEMRARLAQAEADLARVQAGAIELETRAANALDAAARRIESMSQKAVV
jgi:cell division protein ZapA